jgi:hypothetical protein
MVGTSSRFGLVVLGRGASRTAGLGTVKDRLGLGHGAGGVRRTCGRPVAEASHSVSAVVVASAVAVAVAFVVASVVVVAFVVVASAVVGMRLQEFSFYFFDQKNNFQ